MWHDQWCTVLSTRLTRWVSGETISRARLLPQLQLSQYWTVQSYASNAFFPSLCQRDIDALLKLSRTAVRSFYGLPRWSGVSHLYRNLGIPTNDQVFSRKVVVFVYRCLSHRASPLFDGYFKRTSDRRTRGHVQCLLEVPFWPGPSGRATIQFRGSLWWNSLPPSVRLQPTLPRFRENVKQINIAYRP